MEFTEEKHKEKITSQTVQKCLTMNGLHTFLPQKVKAVFKNIS